MLDAERVYRLGEGVAQRQHPQFHGGRTAADRQQHDVIDARLKIGIDRVALDPAAGCARRSPACWWQWPCP